MSGGLPFRILEAARSAQGGCGDLAVSGLPATPRWACSAGWPCSAPPSPPTSWSPSPASTRTRRTPRWRRRSRPPSVEPAETGYRFRHALVRETVLADLRSARTLARGRRRSPSGWPSWEPRRPGSPTSSSLPGIRRRRSRTRGGPSRPPAPWVPTATGCTLIDAVIDHAVRRRPRSPARPARRPAARPRRPGGGGGVPRGRLADHRHRAPAGAGPGWLGRRPSPATWTAPPRRSPGSRSRATRPTGRSCWPGATWPTSPATSTARTPRPTPRGPCSSPTTRGRLSTWSASQGLIAAPAGRVVRAVPARAAAHPGRPEPGDRGLRRPPVRRGVPALRPGPLPRGDRGSPSSCGGGPSTTARCGAWRSRPP